MTKQERTIYLTVMPGKRKPKAIAPSSLAFYKATARLVWSFQGSAADARAAIERGELPPIGGTEAKPQAEPRNASAAKADGVLAEVTLTSAPHAPLEAIYDPRVGQHVLVGTRMGEYAREDDEGVEFRCLGLEENRNFSYSRDYKPGLFYPPNVFVTGRDQNGEALPHDNLRCFLAKLGYGKDTTRPVWLPRGYRAGAPAFEAALLFTPIEMAPDLAYAERLAKARIPGLESVQARREVTMWGQGLV